MVKGGERKIIGAKNLNAMYQRVAGAKKKFTSKSANKHGVRSDHYIGSTFMITLTTRPLLQSIQHVFFSRKIINL